MPSESGKIHVLIVEDEALIADAYAAKFQLSGFDVSVGRNGKEGIELALKEHPDFIVLDVVMPELDGWGFLKRLRKDHWGQSAEVLLLTNISDIEAVDQRLQYGVYDYLVKSNWTPAEIVDHVRERLHLPKPEVTATS